MDYSKLNLKIGLEIHQQLPGKKLFCSCPCIIKDEPADHTIKRKLRAVSGETGEIDKAAKHEQLKEKEFVYFAYDDCTCLVEVDEEPPHEVNKEALKTSIMIAELLNAKIADEIHFMRKTVIDGSNVSGFQRTALIASDGYIETSEGRISIPTICLEEESAKIVERKPDHDVYNLSRLGIPLIEIATGPDIKSPQGAKEAAEKIGMILRSTERVKRGLGTIRQDINLSIKGHSRVEIKGFQDVKSIPKVSENEIERQLKLIKAGKRITSEVRKVEEDGTTRFLRPMPGSARMYPETDVMPIKGFAEKEELPELIDEKAHRLEKLGLSKDLAELIAKRQKADVFDEFVNSFKNLKPAFIAETMFPKLREIKRKYNVDAENIPPHKLNEVFEKLNNSEIAKESLEEILVEIAKGNAVNYSKYKTIGEEELEKEIKKIIENNKGAPFGTLMGIAMAKFRGKADGKKVSESINKLIKK